MKIIREQLKYHLQIKEKHLLHGLVEHQTQVEEGLSGVRRFDERIQPTICQILSRDTARILRQQHLIVTNIGFIYLLLLIVIRVGYFVAIQEV